MAFVTSVRAGLSWHGAGVGPQVTNLRDCSAMPGSDMGICRHALTCAVKIAHGSLGHVLAHVDRACAVAVRFQCSTADNTSSSVTCCLNGSCTNCIAVASSTSMDANLHPYGHVLMNAEAVCPMHQFLSYRRLYTQGRRGACSAKMLQCSWKVPHDNIINK